VCARPRPCSATLPPVGRSRPRAATAHPTARTAHPTATHTRAPTAHPVQPSRTRAATAHPPRTPRGHRAPCLWGAQCCDGVRGRAGGDVTPPVAGAHPGPRPETGTRRQRPPRAPLRPPRIRYDLAPLTTTPPPVTATSHPNDDLAPLRRLRTPTTTSHPVGGVRGDAKGCEVEQTGTSLPSEARDQRAPRPEPGGRVSPGPARAQARTGGRPGPGTGGRAQARDRRRAGTGARDRRRAGTGARDRRGRAPRPGTSDRSAEARG